MNSWPTASLTVLVKGPSDHRPLLLESVPVDFGHIPFRVFYSWLEIPGFVEFVEHKCSRFRFVGSADLALATKLKWLKGCIKGWLVCAKSQAERSYDFRKAEVDRLLEIAESRTLLPPEEDYRLECKAVVDEFDLLKMRDMQQKSRVRWAIDGDDNSRFFHGILNSNLSCNRVHGLYINGDWVTNPTVIKNEVYDFFSKKFSETGILEASSGLSKNSPVDRGRGRLVVKTIYIV
ncbi:uncharacterized protein LOC143531635 [Bidens hawaiensis]|uniref:uncharacterized protein LOC143531635 n=1 Tax=Bidens hawaiensis TaxID=980011 RepID=UPI00404B9CE2